MTSTEVLGSPDEREPLVQSSSQSDSYRSINANDNGEKHDGGDGRGGDHGVSVSPRPLGFSVLRARIVSSAILILYAMAVPNTTSIIAQYLQHRWMQDANISSSLTANHSACSKSENGSLAKTQDDIQSRVSLQSMYFSYTSSIPAIFSCLVLGSLSDSFGRRLLLLTPILGSVARLTINFFIIQYDMNINYFYLSSGLDGITGSIFAMLIASFTVSVDISVGKSSRIIWIVILEAIAKVTMSTSSIATGYLIDYLSFAVASLFQVGPIVLALLLAFFFMPETRPKEKATSKQPGLWSNIVGIARMYATDGTLRDRQALFCALTVFFFTVFNMLNISSIDTLYQMNEPFCWSATFIGYYSAAKNLVQAFLGGVYIKSLQMCGCISDEMISMTSSLFMAGSMAMEAFITETWQFFLVPIVGSPSFVAAGVIRGVMSMLVGSHKQGAMFASVAVFETICNILATTVYNQVYAATVSTLPGAVYLVMAGVGVLTFLLYLPFFYFYDDPSKREKTLEIPTPEVQGYDHNGPERRV